MGKTVAVIPARYESSRFPGKPLALICGKPMIQWVFEATVACEELDETIVATDDRRIEEAAKAFGAEVAMTSSQHLTGTDRICEVAEKRADGDVYVNVQGDQPFVTAEIIQRLVAPFRTSDPPEMSTVACPFPDSGKADGNTVTVVCDQELNALYFSRCDIPFRFADSAEKVPAYHHLGLYAFSFSFLLQFRDYQATPLEKSERLEQLRVLENGHRIKVSLIDEPLVEVNTPADLDAANQLMSDLLASGCTRKLGT